MTETPDFPALVELIQRLDGKDRKTCELALYTLSKQDERLIKKDARIAELEATIRKFQLVEKALNYFLEKDTPYLWRYGRNEAEELARAALGEKDD